MCKTLVAACAIALAVGAFATAGAGPSRAGTAATRVSQTSAGFECGPNASTSVNTDTEQTCVVTGPNARCVEKSTSPVVAQTCDITQTGDVNNAFVNQVIDTNGAPTSSNVQTQTGTQEADVKQAGNQNSVDLSQTVNQSLNTSAVATLTQDQDAALTANVCQGGPSDCTSPNDGANESKIQQSRYGSAHASAATVTQCQDTGETGCAPPPSSTSSIVANVDQNSNSSNDSDLHQDAHLLGQAGGASGTVSQKQHCPSGGIQGHVDQVPGEIEAPASPNQPTVVLPRNTNNAHEHLTDELSGPKGSDQSQDPGLGCCSIGGGGPQSSNNVHQVGTLKASENDAFQQLDITGEAQSGGGCSVLQVGQVNTDSFTTRDSEPDAVPCSAFINCESGSEGGGCSGFPPKGPIGDELALTQLGADASDFADALNFTFPVSLPGLP